MGSISVTVGDIGCIHPDDKLRESLMKSGIETINEFTQRGGREASSGRFLMLLKDLTDTLTDSSELEIEFSDGNNTITIGDLAITKTIYSGAVEMDNGLVIVEVADKRYFSDTIPRHFARFASGRHIPVFPLHPRFVKVSGYVTTWDQGFREFWFKSSVGGWDASNVDSTNVDFPTVILTDYQPQSSTNGFINAMEVLELASHRIYKTQDGWVVYPIKHPSTTNDTLVNDSEPLLLQKRFDKAGSFSYIPHSVQVRFPMIPDYGDSSIRRQWYTRDINYTGGENTVVQTSGRQIDLPNNWWDDYYDRDDHQDDLHDLADKVAELYFNAFDNHLKYNAIYFGILPFESSPNADTIWHYLDLKDGKFKTMVKSIDVVNDHSFPLLTDNFPHTIPTLQIAVVVGDASYGAGALVEIRGSGGGNQQVIALYNWCDDPMSVIADGSEVILGYFKDDGQYRIIGKVCP